MFMNFSNDMEMNTFRSVLFDPFNENRDFRCDICNKYLSIAPILFHESVGKICGRCFAKGETKKYADLTFEKQTVYEEIAKHIIYPCSFRAKGCIENLKWSQVGQHEDSCHFRDNKCPFGQVILVGKKCDWRGDNENFFLHLWNEHSGYINDLKMSIPASNDPKNSLVISRFMDIPVVAILFVSDDLKHCFFHLLMDPSNIQCEVFTYDLEVSDGEEKYRIVFPENRVARLCERAFTSNCLENGFNIDLTGLRTMLRSQCLNFWFKIKSKQSYSIKEESHLSSNKYLLFDQKCVTCKNILLDPIYVCTYGHNICSNCYQTNGYCDCKMKITGDRNTILENLSKMALYECKNKDQGCSKLSSSKEIMFHEQNCKLTVKDCVMKCGWKGNNVDMLKHMREVYLPHLYHKINLNEDNLFERSKQDTNGYYTIWDDTIFVLHICYDKSYKSLSVNIQYLGAEAGKYRYEFVIRSGKLKLQCCHFCQPILYGTNGEKPQAIIYPFDFLKQFLLEQHQFYFKVNIFS